MPDHRTHGHNYQQPDRHDELSEGVPAQEQADARHERTAGGQIVKGAVSIPTLGGKARKNRTKLSHGIDAIPVSEALKKRARYMRKRTCTELARTVGGGECGILASAMGKLGSEDLALREAALAAGEIDLARRLGESARMHLLYARETCAKDAKARGEADTGPDPWEIAKA